MGSAFLGIEEIGNLLTEAEEPIAWIVQTMIPRGGIAFLVARPGAGKSLLAYHIAACVATGSPVLGSIPVTAGAVAYIDLDGRKAIGAMRAAAALRGIGLEDGDIPNVPLYIAAHQSSVDLRNSDVLYRVIEEVSAIPALALVLLDTWSDLHHGKEQSPDDMTDVARAVMEIATHCNCGVLVIHHQRKNGGTNELDDVRGAGSITAKADSVYILKTERDDEGDPGALTLLQRKARLTEEAPPRKFRVVSDGDVDGRLIAYRYDLTEATKMGRPDVAKQEAERIAAKLMREHPDMARSDLVRELKEVGVSQMTAYRVASDLYQKCPTPPHQIHLVNGASLAAQGETGFPPHVPEKTSGNRTAVEDLDI